jgi:hypothetical protein
VYVAPGNITLLVDVVVAGEYVLKYNVVVADWLVIVICADEYASVIAVDTAGILYVWLMTLLCNDKDWKRVSMPAIEHISRAAQFKSVTIWLSDQLYDSSSPTLERT